MLAPRKAAVRPILAIETLAGGDIENIAQAGHVYWLSCCPIVYEQLLQRKGRRVSLRSLCAHTGRKLSQPFRGARSLPRPASH